MIIKLLVATLVAVTVLASDDTTRSEVEQLQKLNAELQTSNDQLKLELAKYKYPVLSEEGGWTDRNTQISPDQETIDIKVLADELPWNEEFAAEVVVGKWWNSSEFIKTKLWTGPQGVHYSVGISNGMVDIQNFTQISRMQIRVPIYVTIMSNSYDTYGIGSLLGQYQYDSLHHYYVQTSTFDDPKPRYLYRHSNGDWWVGYTPGERRGWFWNKQKTETVPTSGWQVADGNGGWLTDPTLTITAGPLSGICNEIFLNASGLEDISGTFKLTPMWYYGRPVYRNDNDFLLYVSNADNWSVGFEIEVYKIKSVDAPLSAVEAVGWVYWNGSADELVNVVLECKN